MRNILNLGIAVFLLSACTSEEKLDREKALSLLKEEKTFPKTIEEEIYIADPEEAKKILDSGFEKEGLLTIQRTQSFSDIGEPLISFTQKATPFLIPQSEEDKKNGIRRVKIAEQELAEVTGVQTLDGDKQAIVEYKVVFKNVTPFSMLSQIDLSKESSRRAKFLLYDDGWRIEEINKH